VRVLGIDASLRSTGFAVLDGDRRRQAAVEFGVITTPAGATLESTLRAIADGVEGIIDRHRPEALAIEDIFGYKDTRTALLLGHVRGVVIFLCARRGMEVAQYAATTIKQTVTGSGRADKQQVQNMVVRTLSLSHVPPHDAADALAAALTHVFHLPLPGVGATP
jgi:crossover junction endodeoxyribonuclease RuvC